MGLSQTGHSHYHTDSVFAIVNATGALKDRDAHWPPRDEVPYDTVGVGSYFPVLPATPSFVTNNLAIRLSNQNTPITYIYYFYFNTTTVSFDGKVRWLIQIIYCRHQVHKERFFVFSYWILKHASNENNLIFNKKFNIPFRTAIAFI